MSPFLRGASSNTGSEIKGLRDFVKSCSTISNDDKKKFHSAIKEHNHDNSINAERIYKELLIKYEDNEVIKYNLDLIEKK